MCPGGGLVGGLPGVSAHGSTPPWADTPLPQCMLKYSHPLVNGITDRCKNITLPQLRLRAVITIKAYFLQYFIFLHSFCSKRCVIAMKMGGGEILRNIMKQSCPGIYWNMIDCTGLSLASNI